MNRRNTMKAQYRYATNILAVAVVLSLGACGGMSERGESTAVGAGVGGVAGAVLTGGSAAGTVGGAVVGGVVGNEIKR
jgi:osmotically inducible lipoprotein OsmB